MRRPRSELINDHMKSKVNEIEQRKGKLTKVNNQIEQRKVNRL